jgi:hypothetical protein
MLEKLKGEILFRQLLKRPDINKAYAMVKPTDSWYDTITKVHNSLAEIQKRPHDVLEIAAHDGTLLKGMYYPGEPESKITVICIHGYTSHAEREWAFPGLFYLSLGYNVLIPYLRAHGPSEGKYISFGPMESLDIQRWIDKVNDRVPGSILLHGADDLVKHLLLAAVHGHAPFGDEIRKQRDEGQKRQKDQSHGGIHGKGDGDAAEKQNGGAHADALNANEEIVDHVGVRGQAGNEAGDRHPVHLPCG